MDRTEAEQHISDLFDVPVEWLRTRGVTFLNPDGTLRIVDWATALPRARPASQELLVDTGSRPARMAHSDATGEGLVTNGSLGVDTIRVAAGSGFAPHTHPGHHLLIVVAGEGTITYDGRIYPTRAGQVYMVEGAVPHAVGAITDHVILAVGSPHKRVDSDERMVPVPYEEVLSEAGSLECTICAVHTLRPGVRLRDLGCPHDPHP